MQPAGVLACQSEISRTLKGLEPIDSSNKIRASNYEVWPRMMQASVALLAPACGGYGGPNFGRHACHDLRSHPADGR